MSVDFHEVRYRCEYYIFGECHHAANLYNGYILCSEKICKNKKALGY